MTTYSPSPEVLRCLLRMMLTRIGVIFRGLFLINRTFLSAFSMAQSIFVYVKMACFLCGLFSLTGLSSYNSVGWTNCSEVALKEGNSHWTSWFTLYIFGSYMLTTDDFFCFLFVTSWLLEEIIFSGRLIEINLFMAGYSKIFSISTFLLFSELFDVDLSVGLLNKKILSGDFLGV